MIDQKFLTSNKQKSAYNTTGFAKFQRLRILHNLLLALLNQEIKKITSHGVECKTTNQKTRVRNFTKKKENRTALHKLFPFFYAFFVVFGILMPKIIKIFCDK